MAGAYYGVNQLQAFFSSFQPCFMRRYYTAVYYQPPSLLKIEQFSMFYETIAR